MATTAAKNSALNGMATTMTHASLHSGYPGASGANEISGGGYTRQSRTWGSASGGNMSASNQPTFSVPAGNIAWLGEWNNVSGGTFQDVAPLGGSPKNFTADTTANTIRSAAHGYSNDDTVVFYDDTPPAPLVEGTIYYVVNATTDTFQVSGSQGGGAISLTAQAADECKLSLIAVQNVSAGTFQVTSRTVTANF